MNGDYRIAHFEEGHQGQVIELLANAFPHSPFAARMPDFFDWKHRANPFGRSRMWVAERDRTVVGFRAFMPWQLSLNGEQIRAVRPVDAVTHPDHRRRGIFAALTRTALESLRAEFDLVFNTPNEKSLPGLLQMGWVHVGEIGVRAWRRAPLPSTRSAAASWQDLAHIGTVGPSELGAVLSNGSGRVSTHLTSEFVRWRFSAPRLDYRVLPKYRSDGSLEALGVARRRPNSDGSVSLVVARVFVGAGEVAAARSVLREVLRVARCSKAFLSEPDGSTSQASASSAGFIWRRRGAVLVTNPLVDVGFDVVDRNLWGLGYLESEVF